MAPININWTNLNAVRAVARRMGSGMLIVRHDGRANYNIVHVSRRDLWNKRTVTVIEEIA
jgi:hypothetical protein